jgi:hypothetical protein
VPNRHHSHRLTQPDKISSENKSQNSGVFLDAKNTPQNHHDLPATHHNITTKNHTKNTPFPQNHLQKRPSHHTKKKYGPAKSRTAFQPYKSTRLTRRRE